MIKIREISMLLGVNKIIIKIMARDLDIELKFEHLNYWIKLSQINVYSSLKVQFVDKYTKFHLFLIKFK